MASIPRHLTNLAYLAPSLVPLLADRSPEGRRALVDKLADVCRAERERGLAGHWTYEISRHRSLLGVYKMELAALNQA